MENTSDALTLVKVLSNDLGMPEFLLNPDDFLTESGNETLKLLMNIIFPRCEDDGNQLSEVVVYMVKKGR